MSHNDEFVRMIRELSTSDEARARFIDDPRAFGESFGVDLTEEDIRHISENLQSELPEDLDERLSKSICLY